jgi:hypothetical protein
VHQPAACWPASSAKLSEQVQEFVWNAFTKRVVVDSTQSAPDICRTLLPCLFFGTCRRFRRLRLSRAARLASILATQPLVPPRAGNGASYKAAPNAQRPFTRSRLAPIRVGRPPPCEKHCSLPTRTGKPNGRSFVPDAIHICWGVRHSCSRYDPSRVATNQVRRH